MIVKLKTSTADNGRLKCFLSLVLVLKPKWSRKVSVYARYAERVALMN